MLQVEIDTEKHTLTQTKKLSDGTYEKIFSRNPRGPAGSFTYNCHLCGVPNLPGEKGLQTHITGKKHQNRLLYNYVPDAEQFRSFIEQGKMTQTIFPGEPIPPGFEDEMKPVCHMDGIIAKIDKPLIGLEYILELHDIKAKEPLYVCTLCDKRCDPRNIIPQITSHRHRMKYLDNHFPKIMNILNRQQRFNVDMSYREEVLTKIAAKIEEKSKRQKPSIHDYKKYETSKAELTDELLKLKHFGEDDFPECIELVSENGKQPDDYENVSSSDSEFMDYNETSRDVGKGPSKMKFEDARFDKRSKYEKTKESRESYSYSKAKPTTEIPQKSEKLKKILTPRELSEQSNAKMQEKYQIEKYKASVSIACESLDKKLREYVKNPEKHPLYSDEWKAFWSRRYKELMAQGKDANSHDYKPEWVDFWMKRMVELNEQEKQSKKTEIRRKLNLTADFVSKIELDQPATKVKSKSRSKSPRRRSRSPLPQKSRRSRSPPRRNRRSRSPIEISDESDDENYRRPARIERKRPRYEDDRSRSKFSESPLSYRSSSNFRDIRRSPSPDIYANDGEINLVSVCRLLSALESELGILAGRVLDLLTKAVAMEKSQANSCDQLLLENDNMILMETAKERLKGGLSAGLVSTNRISPVKRAIQQIAALIHETNKKKIENPVAPPKRIQEAPKPSRVQDPNEVARLEIARVLTESLIEQGRGDISQEELEEMIDSLMQEGIETVKEEEPEPVKVDSPVASPPRVKAPEPEKIEPKKPEKDDTFSELENLTDDDLKTLLRNFSDLTCDEQNHLITYLSKIENTDRQRVERLRKYVDIGDDEIDSESDGEEVKEVPVVKPQIAMSPEKAQILSDDEYEDKDIVQSINATLNNEPKTSALANTGAVANELMTSLMSSFMQTSSWDAPPVQQPPHQESWEMPQDQQWMMPPQQQQQQYYNQPMPMQGVNMVNPMAPWQQPPPGIAPHMQDMPMMGMNQYPPNGGGRRMDMHRQMQDNMPYRNKRVDRTNNMQLTGKGKGQRR